MLDTPRSEEDSMIRHLPRLRHLLRWRNLRWALLAATVPVGLWACNSHSLEAPNPLPETQTELYEDVNPIRKIDLIFMIDNSNSMKEEQENLARNFPAFMRELENIPGGLPDVRIAVINSDVGAGTAQRGEAGTCYPGGERGRFQTQGVQNDMKVDCGLDPSVAHFLADDGRGNRNFNGRLADVFACIAQQGVSGCGYEHQLQAVRAALARNLNPENQEFIREDAFLGIVLLTDEDDCSADPEADFFTADYMGEAHSFRCNRLGHVCEGTPVPAMDGFKKPLSSCVPAVRNAQEIRNKLINVEDIAQFVKSVKGGRAERIVVSAIMGWSPQPDAEYSVGKNDEMVIDILPICSTAAAGKAAPAVRIKAFLDAFPHSSWHSICQTDLSQAMQDIGKQVAARLVNTCFEEQLVDVDPRTPGIQPDCQVADRISKADGYTDVYLPQCRGNDSQPCWHLVESQECGSRYKIEVDRQGNMAPPGTVQVMKCLTCTDTRANDPRCGP
jgi:hypothetical protein